MNIFEIKESMLMAMAAIRAHKMRAFLTILGVLVGVTTVIAMVSIITGLNKSMARQIESMGSNSIWVTKTKIDIQFGGPSEEERKREPITFEDAIAVRELCPSVEAVSPQNWGPGPLFSGETASTEGQSSWTAMASSKVMEGRFLSSSEGRSNRMPISNLVT